jgi:DNA helicase HerA-like ATPase
VRRFTPDSGGEHLRKDRKIGEMIVDGASGRLGVYVYDPESVSVGALTVAEWGRTTRFLAVLQISGLRYFDPYSTGENVDVQRKIGINVDQEVQYLPGRYVVADVRVLATYDVSGSRWRQIPPVVIPPRTPVRLLDQSTFEKIYGECVHCVSLGRLAYNPDVEVRLDVNALFKLHQLVVGSTGSGKSWEVAVMLENLAELNPRPYVVVLDISREYCDVVEQLGGVCLRAFKDVVPDLKVLSPSEFTQLVGRVLTSELQGEIVEVGFKEFKRSLGTTPQDLLNSVLSTARRFNARDETVENMRTRLSTFLTHLYGTLSKAPTDVDVVAKMLKDSGLVAVEVEGGAELNIMANWVYATLRQMRQDRKLDLRGVIVVLDEAHQVVPRGEDTPAKGAVLQALRYGRHHGVYLLLITQFPASLEPEVLALVSTVHVFSLPHSQLGVLREKVPGIEDVDVARLPTGICVIGGTRDRFPFPLVVAVRSERKTTHKALTLPVI